MRAQTAVLYTYKVEMRRCLRAINKCVEFFESSKFKHFGRLQFFEGIFELFFFSQVSATFSRPTFLL